MKGSTFSWREEPVWSLGSQLVCPAARGRRGDIFVLPLPPPRAHDMQTLVLLLALLLAVAGQVLACNPIPSDCITKNAGSLLPLPAPPSASVDLTPAPADTVVKCQQMANLWQVRWRGLPPTGPL
jgi:hypothetical protein